MWEINKTESGTSGTDTMGWYTGEMYPCGTIEHRANTNKVTSGTSELA